MERTSLPWDSPVSDAQILSEYYGKDNAGLSGKRLRLPWPNTAFRGGKKRSAASGRNQILPLAKACPERSRRDAKDAKNREQMTEDRGR